MWSKAKYPRILPSECYKGPQASNVVVTEKAPPSPYGRGGRRDYRF
ncbi:MAG: hypothetical protein ACFFG0_35160 [Candidatus Thorarchaeota archaeon]